MIKERYCSYEVANLLNKKGFDETCYACYEYFKSSITMYQGWVFEYKGEIIQNSTDIILAPTHQMACDWLYENYGLWVQVFLYVTLSKDKKENDFTSKKIRWTFDIVTKFPEKGPYQYYEPVREEFTSQYEAIEAGLKYILKRI